MSLLARPFQGFAAWALLGALAGPALALEPGEFDWGPLASRLKAPTGETRLRVLGPVYERTTGAEGHTLTAVRPLYSRTTAPANEFSSQEWLWPVAQRRVLENASSWRILLAYGINRDITDPASPYRVMVLPIYFQGRNAAGRRHLAVFPLGGRIHDLFGRDEIDFALFPLWARSRMKDQRSTTVLWPIYSRTVGEGIYRFRIFPFYGTSHRDGAYDKKFVLWPFWSQAAFHYPKSSGKGYVLFPFYGKLRLTDQRSTMFLPPLIRFHKGERINSTLAPWPFVQIRSGEQEKFYLWPLYGHRRTLSVESSFQLWPIFRQEAINRPKTVVRRNWAMPFWFQEVERTRAFEPDQKTEVVGRYTLVWPLFSYRREGEWRRWRALELWPKRNTQPVERNWSPWWTVYDRVKGPDAHETTVLWGLYRSRHREDMYRDFSIFPLYEKTSDLQECESGWKLLKGLVGFERSPDRRTLRLLYFLRIPLGGSEP